MSHTSPAHRHPQQGRSPASHETVTLRHPRGSLEVRVPVDIPVDELMPDFVAVSGCPDGEDWSLAPAGGGHPYPGGSTLADCGVTEGSVLALHPHHPGAGHRLSESEAASPVGVPVGAALTARPVSARTVAALPERLSAAQRARIAARAVLDGGAICDAAPGRRCTSVPDPATFTLPARVSPLGRVRQAWTRTDYQRRLDQRIRAPRLARCVTIAIVSPKGGVGKSTTSTLLGSLLAFLRRDRVVAVDTNPDWGSLGRRLVPDHTVFIDDLLSGPLQHGQLTPTQLDAQLGRGPDGLMVAPAPTDPDRAARLDEDAYRTLFARLGTLVGTLVLDCGTGLSSPAARAALASADQLVLVADGEPDTASLVAEAADRLATGHPPLVLLVNRLDRSSRVDVAALETEVDFARGLVLVPTDRAAADRLHASRFSWIQPPRRWRIPVRELAALLAADWPCLEPAAS